MRSRPQNVKNTSTRSTDKTDIVSSRKSTLYNSFFLFLRASLVVQAVKKNIYIYMPAMRETQV